MKLNYLETLKMSRQNKWTDAHQQVQSHTEPLACMIHGYLHRIEGDFANARYWYKRANETMPNNTLTEEFNRLQTLAERLTIK